MLARARLIALAAPALLMAGALGSQYWGGLHPCELCLMQRWPHYIAIGTALLAILLRRQRSVSFTLTFLAGLLILLSGALGAFHAGVEYGWWKGPEHCSGTVAAGTDIMRSILAAPLIRCDQAQWTLRGISLAGWNFLFSTIAGLAVLVLSLRSGR